MPSKVATDLQDRLAALAGTREELARSRVDLIRRMREGLRELRDTRERLLDGRRPAGAGPRPSPAERLAEQYQLTPREVDTALLLASGAPNTLIAAGLRISEHTARHHTRHVLVKLGVRSRARAAAIIGRTLGADAPPIP